MSKISVKRGATEVILVLNEEEALYVLGALGHTTGHTPDTYDELFAALVDAGYDPDFLDKDVHRITVLP